MANDCSYTLIVKGEQEDVQEFILRMKRNYHEGKHFSRIFECNIDYERETEDNLYIAKLFGECAWSMYSCMRKGEHTYFSDLKDETGNFCCLEDTSKELNLEVEYISEEPMMGFKEFFRIKNGDVLKDECIEWQDSLEMEVENS